MAPTDTHRFHRLAIALFSLSLIAPGPAHTGPPELPLPLMRTDGSESLPEFVFSERAQDGAPVERGFIELRGSPVVAVAWASWCGVCRGEMPRLDRLARDLKAEGATVAVLALSIDEGGLPVVERTLRERGLANLRPVHDTQSMFFTGIGAWGVPTSVIANARGEIVARANGPVAWESPAVRDFLRSLAGPSGQAPEPAAPEGARAQLIPAG